ncbi:MAG: Ig-like domain-containing protein, partial [Candidatus Falkowbacteria bacterium]|nr:Ig-like domain-containing protein [Candidatus Falkowbacteria bacterium]
TAVTSDTTANSVAVVVGANTLQVKSSKTVGSSVTWGYSPINTFTVAAAVTPPSVFAQYPLDNAADVAIDVYPTVTFDEDMDVSTINSTNIQMRDYTTDAPISIFVTQSTTSIRTFIINPDIVYGGHYYFYITGAKDLAGNTMTAYTTKALQEFTYVGYVATPPTIESFLPGNNETIGVVIGPGQDAISLTFDKLMYEQSLTTNNIKLYKDDGTEVTLSSVMIQNGANKTIVQLLP